MFCFHILEDRAFSQAVSSRSVTVEDRVQFQAIHFGIYGG